jgi:hypothetical protein
LQINSRSLVQDNQQSSTSIRCNGSNKSKVSKSTPPKYKFVSATGETFYVDTAHRLTSGREIRKMKKSVQKRKRCQRVFTDVHKKRLEEEFEANGILSRERRTYIAKTLNLKERSVLQWFCKRKAEISKK